MQDFVLFILSHSFYFFLVLLNSLLMLWKLNIFSIYHLNDSVLTHLQFLFVTLKIKQCNFFFSKALIVNRVDQFVLQYSFVAICRRVLVIKFLILHLKFALVLFLIVVQLRVEVNRPFLVNLLPLIISQITLLLSPPKCFSITQMFVVYIMNSLLLNLSLQMFCPFHRFCIPLLYTLLSILNKVVLQSYFSAFVLKSIL